MVTSLHHISNRWGIKICLRVKCQALLTFPWEALLRGGWGGVVEGRVEQEDRQRHSMSSRKPQGTERECQSMCKTE